jgi:hypothetical protein
MKQPEFLFIAHNLKVSGVVQSDPETIVNLRPGIIIKHNYRKKDLMTITFTDGNNSYIIPSRKELEEIYRLHLGNADLLQLLQEWCIKNLISA